MSKHFYDIWIITEITFLLALSLFHRVKPESHIYEIMFFRLHSMTIRLYTVFDKKNEIVHLVYTFRIKKINDKKTSFILVNKVALLP